MGGRVWPWFTTTTPGGNLHPADSTHTNTVERNFNFVVLFSFQGDKCFLFQWLMHQIKAPIDFGWELTPGPGPLPTQVNGKVSLSHLKAVLGLACLENN